MSNCSKKIIGLMITLSMLGTGIIMKDSEIKAETKKGEHQPKNVS